MSKRTASLLLATCALGAPAMAQDWPQWGRDETRNMVSEATGLPSSFVAGEFVGASDRIDLTTTKNIRFVAKLGSQSYGNPTVSGGMIFVGTNNDSPRDERYKGDRSCLYAFDEKSGDFLWQLAIPKLGTGKVSDWEFLGICSSPAVEGDRVYLVTNRCEVMCLDTKGLANGNDGPFQDEAKYLAAAGEEPGELKATDADIIWSLNMIDECGVFPHNITSSAVLIAGDQLWVSTSNGVDYGHVETPAPNAPSLILVDKNTGELLAEEASGLSTRILHCNWSSPAFLRMEKTDPEKPEAPPEKIELGIFGGPDGVLYAFKTMPIEGEEGWPILDLAWSYDCNPPEYREKDGKKIPYPNRYGPSEILGTPVIYKDRIYTAIGQDPEHGEGVGNMVCLDENGKLIWAYQKINRSLSTPSIVDDLVFVADFSGFLYCLDANTGKEYWVHDTKGHIWSSTLVADGRVYLGNEDGYMTIVPAKKTYDEKEVIEIDMISQIYSSAIAANGRIYVATHTNLFAIEEMENQ